MTFFLIIVSNVFIGAIFYLIISLKLEKSASEYQVRKFKKEIEEMIFEFNSTAERNIGILENKINIMKKLLSAAGSSGVDILNIENDTALEEVTAEKNNRKMKKNVRKGKFEVISGEDTNFSDNYSIENEHPLDSASEKAPNIMKSEDELLKMFKKTDDRHGLIGDLYSDGYPLEVISRASNIPVGEVKLILNLRGKI